LENICVINVTDVLKDLKGVYKVSNVIPTQKTTLIPNSQELAVHR